MIPKQLYLEVVRKDEFAPIKNKEGENDTPLTAYRIYSEHNKNKIKALGVQIKGEAHLQVRPDFFMFEKLQRDFLEKSKLEEIELPFYLG